MKRCRALALVLVLFSIGHLAHADDDASTLAARQRFREGIEFFDKGQYDNARAAFLQAYALKKHPDILLNLGHTSLKAGRPFEAYKYFKQFTTEAKNPAPDKLQDAQSSLAEAQASLGTISVKAPHGATVAVDGEALGQAPLTNPIITEPGAHTVVVKHDGAERSFTVTTYVGQTTNIDAMPAAATHVTPTPVLPTTPLVPVAPPVEPPPKAKGTSAFTPPRNMVPFWIGVGLTAAAAGGATTMYMFKTSAQDDADSVEKLIRARASQDGISATGICTNKSADIQKVYGNACATLNDNREKVDTNALIGNIFLGVGIASAVGTIVYYFAASKGPKTEEKAKQATWRPIIVPDIRPGQKGLQLSVQF